MDYNTVFNKVSELILAQLPISADQIKPESRLVEDLGADSANIMILICDIENECDVKVENGMLAKDSTRDEKVKYLIK